MALTRLNRNRISPVPLQSETHPCQRIGPFQQIRPLSGHALCGRQHSFSQRFFVCTPLDRSNLRCGPDCVWRVGGWDAAVPRVIIEVIICDFMENCNGFEKISTHPVIAVIQRTSLVSVCPSICQTGNEATSSRRACTGRTG